LPEIAASTGAHAEEDVLGGNSPSFSPPIAVSQLGALTKRPAESRSPWIIGAVAALVLGVGGIFLIKSGGGGHVAPERTGPGVENAEAPANAAPTPPEPKPAEVPPEPPQPEPAPPVTVSPVQVDPSEPPPRQEAKTEAPAPEKAPTPPAEKPRAAASEATAPAKPRSTPETALHRPPPSRSSARGSTYKPGGI
jgi:protein TonB